MNPKLLLRSITNWRIVFFAIYLFFAFDIFHYEIPSNHQNLWWISYVLSGVLFVSAGITAWLILAEEKLKSLIEENADTDSIANAQRNRAFVARLNYSIIKPAIAFVFLIVLFLFM